MLKKICVNKVNRRQTFLILKKTKIMFKQFNTSAGPRGFGQAFRKHHRHHRQGNPFQHMGWKRPKYNVPLNIIESETEFVVNVYATGFSKEDIKLSITDDMLYISGRKTIDEESAPTFSHQEFPIKNFERTLSLNGQVLTDSISAKSESGILSITLPKTAEAQKKEQQITVQ